LSEADLSRANLFESDLTGANLSRALASQTNLHGVNLEDSVLTALRGEPIFDTGSSELFTVIGWPAARLAEPQLTLLAETYLRNQGWGIIEPSPAEDVSIDLMARRDDKLLGIEAKATATPSSSTFTHVIERLRRAADQHANASVFLVIPGPVPESLRNLARANQIGVLGVWGELGSLRIEEVVPPPSDSLAS
jgi:Pentapeptide repeats (8 copies)